MSGRRSVRVFGRNVCHAACHAGDQAKLNVLLAYPNAAMLVDAQDNDGMRPLQELLHTVLALTRTASGGTTGSGARVPPTSLTFVAAVSMIKSLLGAGAGVESADYEGLTPLQSVAAAAKRSGTSNEAVLALARILLSNGAKVGTEDDHGWTALHYAAEAITNAAPAMFELLRAHPTATPLLAAFNPAKPKTTVDSVRKHGAHNRIPIAQRRAVLNGEHTLTGFAKSLARAYLKKGA